MRASDPLGGLSDFGYDPIMKKTTRELDYGRRPTISTVGREGQARSLVNRVLHIGLGRDPRISEKGGSNLLIKSSDHQH